MTADATVTKTALATWLRNNSKRVECPVVFMSKQVSILADLVERIVFLDRLES